MDDSRIFRIVIIHNKEKNKFYIDYIGVFDDYTNRKLIESISEKHRSCSNFVNEEGIENLSILVSRVNIPEKSAIYVCRKYIKKLSKKYGNTSVRSRENFKKCDYCICGKDLDEYNYQSHFENFCDMNTINF